MKTLSKTALVATFLVAAASGAIAQEGPLTAADVNYLRNPNAPVPQYTVQNQAAYAAVQNRLIEGRNVGVAVSAPNFDRYVGSNAYINGGE